MRRRATRASTPVAVLVAVLTALIASATSTARSPFTRDGTTGTTGTIGMPAGLITGHVSGPDGQPLAGISVVAAPAGNDLLLTQGATDANGDYALVVAPGSYDVAFNAMDPVNDAYAAEVYGGPGPSATDTCLVCGGTAQVVTNGGITSGISVKLSPPVQKGTIRALSGNTIKVVANRLNFRFGCHENGFGCIGKGVLRIGTTKDPVVSTVHFQVLSNHSSTLHFTIPSSVLGRLKKAKHNALAAVVQLTTPPSSTTTKFTLVSRP